MTALDVVAYVEQVDCVLGSGATCTVSEPAASIISRTEADLTISVDCLASGGYMSDLLVKSVTLREAIRALTKSKSILRNDD